MEWIGKCCALALCGTCLVLILRKQAPEFAFLTTAACGVLLLFLAADGFSAVMGSLHVIAASLPYHDTILQPLIKAMGISITTRLTSALCRDAGQSALGEKVELIGTVACLMAALPLATAVLELIGGML